MNTREVMIMRKRIIFLSALLVICVSIMTIFSVSVSANESYNNPANGYEAVIEDDAGLLTESEEQMLLEQMKLITEYGNVMFKSIDYNGSSTESYIRSLYKDRYGSESGTIFLIDMDNRNIWIHSNGLINKTITKSYADSITDNVYEYASDKDYYMCAYKAYEQEYTLLQGRRISQPMKYISNALIALVLAVLINYIIVRFYSSQKKASTKVLMNGLFEHRAFNSGNVVFTHQTRTYSPQQSSSGGSSGGGGGSSGGGGGSGGGHSF